MEISDVYKRQGLILVYLGSGIAMSIFILKSAFMGVPKELDEPATIDGAGFFRTFFMINLPPVSYTHLDVYKRQMILSTAL